MYTYNILSCFLLKQSNYPKLNDLSPLGLPFGVQTTSVQSMANSYMEEYDIYQNLSKHCGIFFWGGCPRLALKIIQSSVIFCKLPLYGPKNGDRVLENQSLCLC